MFLSFQKLEEEKKKLVQLEGTEVGVRLKHEQQWKKTLEKVRVCVCVCVCICVGVHLHIIPNVLRVCEGVCVHWRLC